MKRTVKLRDALAEAALDPREIVSHELNQMNIQHRFEAGAKHMHAVYNVNGREHRFPISFGSKWDGPIRHVIKSAIRKHVRGAMALHR